jgi:hypothetical protein
MWCTHCQQDVPGTVRPDDGGYGCLRCGNPLLGDPEDGARSPAEGPNPEETPDFVEIPADAPESSPLSEYDSWELDERLRHIERVLAIGRANDDPPNRESRQSGVRLRVDAAHSQPSSRHRPPSKNLKKRSGTGKQRSPWLGAAIWGALSLGLMALACGGVLVGWSVLAEQDHLWSIGMPIAVGGQILLLLGFVLQIDRLWHDSRDTAAKLDDVDDQIEDLRNTTSILGTTHSTPATSFYAHFASGASPSMLLADLKSQLDLLAVKIADEQ